VDGVDLLCRVMRFLGQAEYPERNAGSLREFWEWAIATWDVAGVPSTRAVSLAETGCSQSSVERELRR